MLIAFDDAISEMEELIKRLNGQQQDREMELARLKLPKLKEVNQRIQDHLLLICW